MSEQKEGEHAVEIDKLRKENQELRKNNLKLSQEKDEILDKDRDKIMKTTQKKLNELDRSRINKLEKLIDMVTAFTLHEKQNVIENVLAGKKA